MRVQCVLRARNNWSVLIKTLGGEYGVDYVFVVMLLIDNVVLQFDSLCWYPNIQDKINTNSKVRYPHLGIILCLK